MPLIYYTIRTKQKLLEKFEKVWLKIVFPLSSFALKNTISDSCLSIRTDKVKKTLFEVTELWQQYQHMSNSKLAIP